MLLRTRYIQRRLVGGALAAAIVVAFAGVAAAQAPGQTSVESTTAAQPVVPAPQTTPFGALSLFVLGGTLFAGLVSGAGLASLRLRRPALNTLVRNSVAAVPDVAPPALSAKTSPKQDTLPPIVAELDGGGENDAAFWIEDLANGPRFGPRIVGVVVAPDCDGDDALARLAALARDTDHDLAIVDACQGAERLADALDLRLERPMRTSGRAGARVEIVRLTDLLGKRARRDALAARDAFAALAARVDVVLVDLPAIENWQKIPTLVAALDDVALLRTAGTRRDELRALCQAARQAGAPITGQVLVMDEAA